MPKVLSWWNVLPVRRYNLGMEKAAVIFEATLVKPLEPRRRPEGFSHVWGHANLLRAGSKLFAYRWEYNGEIIYRCYSSYRDCFNLTEACAKEYLRATRTAAGKLKPLNEEQQRRYEKCVADIDWELNR